MSKNKMSNISERLLKGNLAATSEKKEENKQNSKQWCYPMLIPLDIQDITFDHVKAYQGTSSTASSIYFDESGIVQNDNQEIYRNYAPKSNSSRNTRSGKQQK